METATYVEYALGGAHEEYSTRNPRSLKAHRDAHSHLPGGNTRTVLHMEPFPLTWASAKSGTLTSLDGDTYIDLLGEFSAGIFGHSEPRIAEAVQVALSKGWNYGGNSQTEKEFAQKVCQRFAPSGIELVRFTNSGTEANTTALGAALAITKRRKILVFSGGYHGSTLVFPIALMQGSTAPCMNLPHDFVYAPYNNISETSAILEDLPQDTLAAILVEPVQGSGGCRAATKTFLHFLRNIADKTGAFLIFDEVMCSRLGYSGYSATQGVRGDIVTLGKYVAGGMTFGAFGGRRDIMELFDPSKNQLFHPGTYNNNVLSMHAGLVGLDIYNADEVDRLNKLGDYLKTKVQRIFIDEGIYPDTVKNASSNLIEIDSFQRDITLQLDEDATTHLDLPPMFITARGSMLNVRFSGPNAAKWQALYHHHMLARNIHIAARGYTPLTLCATEAHMDDYSNSIREFVRTHKRQLIISQS
ncbi:putative acetylornithine aminotransferase [Periconia macrospinosa]|uniref:Putative acetylornithine aminotransferase n=1 Tax=Periconia macrospinosa TaxID=97972 RepID=A0A2V1D0Y5_9PLEO|nr:putative acetylornithine aminotransferase [Periconia macrospinosa]